MGRWSTTSSTASGATPENRSTRTTRSTILSGASAPTSSERTMPTINESDAIVGVYIVEPDVHADDRGCFVETYRREWFPHGHEMVQGNRGDRQEGSVVGLHYHLHQADYWYVPDGRARVVLHDLRDGSPTEYATLEIELGQRSDGTH